MSSMDKTRQKLMGSMRKTKAVAGGGADKAQHESEDEAPKATVTAKPASVNKTERVESAKAKPRGIDGYQSRGRVWPD